MEQNGSESEFYEKRELNNYLSSIKQCLGAEKIHDISEDEAVSAEAVLMRLMLEPLLYLI